VLTSDFFKTGLVVLPNAKNQLNAKKSTSLNQPCLEAKYRIFLCFCLQLSATLRVSRSAMPQKSKRKRFYAHAPFPAGESISCAMAQNAPNPQIIL
jgi:hypothetical protein